ncbi:unnamed protein product [Closterium sp. NIES-53]
MASVGRHCNCWMVARGKRDGSGTWGGRVARYGAHGETCPLDTSRSSHAAMPVLAAHPLEEACAAGAAGTAGAGGGAGGGPGGGAGSGAGDGCAADGPDGADGSGSAVGAAADPGAAASPVVSVVATPVLLVRALLRDGDDKCDGDGDGGGDGDGDGDGGGGGGGGGDDTNAAELAATDASATTELLSLPRAESVKLHPRSSRSEHTLLQTSLLLPPLLSELLPPLPPEQGGSVQTHTAAALPSLVLSTPLPCPLLHPLLPLLLPLPLLPLPLLPLPQSVNKGFPGSECLFRPPSPSSHRPSSFPSPFPSPFLSPFSSPLLSLPGLLFPGVGAEVGEGGKGEGEQEEQGQGWV